MLIQPLPKPRPSPQSETSTVFAVSLLLSELPDMKVITREPVSWEGQPRRVLSLQIVGGLCQHPPSQRRETGRTSRRASGTEFSLEHPDLRTRS